MNGAFLSVPDIQMWQPTSARNFPGSCTVAVDCAGAGKLRVVCLNVDFRGGGANSLPGRYYSPGFNSAWGSSPHQLWAD